jgi:hypothetical protein
MLSRYYSLDECSIKDISYEYLRKLEEDGKIIVSIIETDVIKIKDVGLSIRETKDILKYFEDNDIIEYTDMDEDEEEDEEFGDFDDFDDF